MKSTHKAEIVSVELEPHENADSLSVIKLFNGGYTVIVKTEEWKDRKKGVYIVPDSLVPNTEDFSFLFDGPSSKRFDLDKEGYAERNKKEGQYFRVTVRRFRGILSYGLLIPVPEPYQDSLIGTNLADYFGVERYEPQPETLGTSGDAEKPPFGYVPVYDVESLSRYGHVFYEGENVHISEKMHGSNGRFTFSQNQERQYRMFCGSRTQWRKEDDQSLWWVALKNHPEIEEFCRKHPDYVVYGEVYGQVQKGFNYGLPKGQVRIAVFDIWHEGRFLGALEARGLAPNLPWVPEIGRYVPFSKNHLTWLAGGDSLVPGAEHIREGIVVKPLNERTHPDCGRVCLKLVSSDYLEGKR